MKKLVARRASLLVLAIALSQGGSAQGDDERKDSLYLRWEEGTEYSDTVYSRGFAYKTIQFTNLSVALAPPPSQLFRRYTALNLLVTNNDDVRMDVLPELFSCVCRGTKSKVLKYQLPKNAPREALSSFIQANSLIPGEHLGGILTFRGRCKKGFTTHIQIGKIIFQFPFD